LLSSKGAWGLDDYQFLVFLWGASQLINTPIQPSDFLKPQLVESHRSRYLFFLGVAFIHRVKTGPFHEHSAMLHQISELPSWSKANSGLIKMYDGEVLSKFPIVQHIQFGRLLPFVKYDGQSLGVKTPPEQQQATKQRMPVPQFTDAI